MSERRATPRVLRYIMYLIGIGIVIAGGYYVLFNMTINNFEVKVEHFEFEYDFGYLSSYSIDVNMSIGHSGFLKIMLSERETTLYINGMNLGPLSFSEPWESYSSGPRRTYSGTYLTTDLEDIQKLSEDMVYDMTLKLKARASSGPFYKYVEVIDEHSFDVEHYTRESDCALCEGEGWVDCLYCVGGDNVCYQCDGTGWDDCWLSCDEGKSDCYACTDGRTDCYVCEDGKSDCYYCTDGCEKCDNKGWTACTFCNGQGWNACNFCNSQGWNICTYCNGKGGETCNRCGGDGLVDCYFCDGEGRNTCSGCGGDGLVGGL